MNHTWMNKNQFNTDNSSKLLKLFEGIHIDQFNDFLEIYKIVKPDTVYYINENSYIAYLDYNDSTDKKICKSNQDTLANNFITNFSPDEIKKLFNEYLNLPIKNTVRDLFMGYDLYYIADFIDDMNIESESEDSYSILLNYSVPDKKVCKRDKPCYVWRKLFVDLNYDEIKIRFDKYKKLKLFT